MKATSKANISILLAVAGPFVLYVGALSAMGDPSPSATSDQIARAEFIIRASIILGLTSIASSLWLSGSAFSTAPLRSLSALALCVVLFTALWFFG